MRKTTLFRKLMNDQDIMVIPGAFCALVAIIIEKTGFPAVYMTGYGTSSAILGKPDVGFVTLTEMVLNAKNIASAVTIPVISDADTGYGNPINVTRTIREFEQSGVVGIHMEDQVWPKKCGHTKGKRVIPAEEMVGKLKAALDARIDEDFIIIARTDARAVLGLDEAIKRGVRYAEAGADMVFVDAPQSEDELRKIAKEIPAPLMVNMSEGGLTPVLGAGDLREMGYKIVIYPTSALLAATKSIMRLMRELKQKGTTADYMNNVMLLSDFHGFIGFPEIYELEKIYGVEEVAP